MKYLFIYIISLFIGGCQTNKDIITFDIDKEKLYFIVQNNKCGYIDYTGNIIIPPQYKSGSRFSNDTAVVQNLQGEYAYINLKNEVFLTIKNKNIYPVGAFNEGIAFYDLYGERFNQYFAINNKGDVLWTDFYSYVKPYQNGVCMAVRRNRYGSLTSMTYLLDRKGKVLEVIDSSWQVSNFNQDGIASKIRHSDSTLIFFNTQGKEILRKKCSETFRNFSEGLVLIGNKYYDLDGKCIISFENTNILALGSFHNGLAYVVINEKKHGFIDKTGKVQFILDKYESNGNDFSDGLLFVGCKAKNKKDNSCNTAILNTEGKIIVDCCNFFPDNGLLNREFNQSTLCRVIIDKCTKNEHWGYINKQGEIIWESLLSSTKTK